MRTPLKHLACAHDDDLVVVANRRESVGDSDGGDALRDAIERLGDRMLRVRVERRGRLVQNQQLGLLDDRTRDRDPLLLPARELAARLADLAVVTLRETLDKVVRARQLGCAHTERLDLVELLELLARREHVLELRAGLLLSDLGEGEDGLVEVAVGGRANEAVRDALHDGAVEQHRLLTHHADLRPQPAHVVLAHIGAIEQDTTGRRIVETLQQRSDRRLARARQPTSATRCPAGTEMLSPCSAFSSGRAG